MSVRIITEYKAEMDGVTVIARRYFYGDNYSAVVIAAYINGKRMRVLRESLGNGWMGRYEMVKSASALLMQFA